MSRSLIASAYVAYCSASTFADSVRDGHCLGYLHCYPILFVKLRGNHQYERSVRSGSAFWVDNLMLRHSRLALGNTTSLSSTGRTSDLKEVSSRRLSEFSF
jgi:hypothetical protein